MATFEGKQVLKYKCIHCDEWVFAELYAKHSMTHFKDTMLPVPDTLDAYISRFISIGLIDASDIETKNQ